MKRILRFGIILSCFLLLMAPCINAIQTHEIRDEIRDKFQENNLLNNLNSLNIKNINFIKSFINVLFLIYIVGYFAFLPFAWFLTLANNPYGNPSLFELIIGTILGSFAWPIIVIAIIRAYIEDLHVSQKILKRFYDKVMNHNNDESDSAPSINMAWS